jgi:hypothetical protein
MPRDLNSRDSAIPVLAAINGGGLPREVRDRMSHETLVQLAIRGNIQLTEREFAEMIATNQFYARQAERRAKRRQRGPLSVRLRRRTPNPYGGASSGHHA